MEVFPKVLFSFPPLSFWLGVRHHGFHEIEIHFPLSLNGNNISAEGAKALADALRTNTTLATLK
jgi:hypothetical protein